MKKLLFVFAIAAGFAACGAGSQTATTTDSTNVSDSTVAAAPTDSTATPAVDSAKVDSTVAPAVDTTKK